MNPPTTTLSLPLLDWLEQHLPWGLRDLVHNGRRTAADVLSWAGPYGRAAAAIVRTSSSLTSYRDAGNDAAIVFVHGFSVDPASTWGRFPELLVDEPALAGWDVYSLGYHTHLAPDVRGVWSADPSVTELALHLRSRAQIEPLRRHRTLALVAHSMGGLVVQKALVDDEAFAAKVSHLIMFGTPSDGLSKAYWTRFLKSQLHDMGKGSDFITELRTAWDTRFGDSPPFELWTVAGDRDVFVPSASSLGPFPERTRLVVPGNHLDIVHASTPDMMSVRLVVGALLGSAAPAGPWNSARVAVQRHDFRRAVDLLLPHATELDDQHLVELALALDELGSRDEAVRLLAAHADAGTDVMGTLAGRLKRSWMASGRKVDADTALMLYQQAFSAASAMGDHGQAAYNGINTAFMTLAYRRDRERAREVADEVLAHLELTHDDHWRAATEGEAYLYLGQPDEALEAYRRAVAFDPAPREVESMYTQAYWVAGILRDHRLQERLDEVFRLGAPLPVG